MPETKLERAVEVADRPPEDDRGHGHSIRRNRINVTASFGVAPSEKRVRQNLLLQDADRRLYEAKIRGRNRTMPDMRIISFRSGSMPDPLYQYLN